MPFAMYLGYTYTHTHTHTHIHHGTFGTQLLHVQRVPCPLRESQTGAPRLGCTVSRLSCLPSTADMLDCSSAKEKDD